MDTIWKQPTNIRDIAARADVIIHEAAQPGVRSGWGKSFEIYSRNNIEATQILLDAAKDVGVKRVVYASSSSVQDTILTFCTASQCNHVRPIAFIMIVVCG